MDPMFCTPVEVTVQFLTVLLVHKLYSFDLCVHPHPVGITSSLFCTFSSPSLSVSVYPCLLGCGFNVSNSNPTICINDLVVQHNRERGSKLSPLSPAQLIGRSVTLLEQLISDFQLYGPEAVLPIYYKRWVHG